MRFAQFLHTPLGGFGRIASVLSTSATIVLAATAPLSAQAKPPVKPADSAAKKIDAMSHDMSGTQHTMQGKKMEEPKSGWKELDAYHALMMATWHPAKSDGDMGPIRAKANAMVVSAKALAVSTPPKACATPKLKEAATKLAPQTQVIADMVAKNMSNNMIKDSLRVLHEHFEVLEEGCSPMKGEMKHDAK